MREDMFKVIVERPRRRYGDPSVLSRDGRHFRNQLRPDEDGGHAPHRLGMKAGYGNRKYLNENLAPLGRWLASQVNRPWDKVYAELCENIDRRNIVQEHIFAHLENFVAYKTRLEGDVIVARSSAWEGTYVPIDRTWQGMFVHPRTGILLTNRARIQRARANGERQRRETTATAAQMRYLSESTLCLRINDAWFVVEIAPLPPGVPVGKVGKHGRQELQYEKRWDVVRKELVSLAQEPGRPGAGSPYGKRGWYAIEKRQMGADEIRRHGLNKKARDSRPFCIARSQSGLRV